MQKLFMRLAVCVGILGIIGSIVLANQPKVALSSSLKAVTAPNFDPFILIAGIISTALATLLLYAISEIFSNLETLHNGQREILRALDARPNSGADTPQTKTITYGGQPQRTNNLPWTCSQCHTANPCTCLSCQSCGKKRPN